MPELNADAWAKIYLAIYCLIGMPVVKLHIRQQRMNKSIRDSHAQGVSGIVIYTLAALWPLLLLAMGLKGLQSKQKPQRDGALKSDGSSAVQS